MSRTASAGPPRCRACGKGIVWPGLCYTCATGLPRRLCRPEEYRREPADGQRRLATSGADDSPAMRREDVMSKKGGNKAKTPPTAPMANKGPKKQ